MMRTLIPVALAASLFATNLYAADAVAPLAPGQPAGVKKAQNVVDDYLGWILVGGVGIAIIALVSSGGSSTNGNTVAAGGTTTS